MNLEDFLILEKRIGQITQNIEITFAFDVIKTNHATDRQDFAKRGYDVETFGKITNAEMNEFVSMFKRDIAENIARGIIKNQTNFVIKSNKWQLAMAIVASNVDDTYWKLIIKTVFRETEDYKLKIAKNQLVLEK